MSKHLDRLAVWILYLVVFFIVVLVLREVAFLLP